MTFFYDINKKLADIAAQGQTQALTESATIAEGRPGTTPAPTAPAAPKPKSTPFTYTIQGSDKVYGGGGGNEDPLASGELDKASNPWPKESTGDYSAKKARAGKDIGKPGKNFEKIAKSAGERYGSKAAGERVAGAVLNKLRKGVREDGADLRDLSQFPTTPGGAAMGNPSIANQAAKARDMKEAEQPTETVGAVIKRVLGPALTWKPGHSKMFKNTRRSRTQRVDDYVMKYVTIKGKKGKYGYLEANAGDQLAVDLKDALIQAGYPVYDNLLISGSGVSFQTRTPITTTAESGVAEADMEEGNDFTGARLAAIRAGKNTFSVGGKNYRVTGDTSDEKMSEGRIDDLMDKRREAEREHGAKRPVAKSATRFVAGKSYGGSAQQDDAEDDDETTSTQSDQPKKRGRPKGTGRKLGAKGPSGKSKLLAREDMAPGAIAGDEGEYGNEGDMAKDQIHTIVRNARDLEKVLANNEDLPEWVQAKLAKIEGMMTAVSDYIQTQHERGVQHSTGEEGVEISEKAVSVAQRRAAGIAHAAQKGEIPKSKLRGASKEMAKMSKGELHKFAATKEKGLPTKVAEQGKPDFLDLDGDGNKTEPMKQAAKQAKPKKKEVDETTVSGSVATATAAPKAGKGMQFGKGIYDSLNREVESIISEGMNISVNMSTSENGEPNKSVTVNADGSDAKKLAEILKLAGLHGSEDSGCEVCGSSPCGCAEVVDENHPNWPTDSETSGDALQYSGGLNGPKSTGQTTIPVLNTEPRRQHANEDLGLSLYQELKSFKG